MTDYKNNHRGHEDHREKDNRKEYQRAQRKKEGARCDENRGRRVFPSEMREATLAPSYH
jgi:hypothetical protein